MKIHETLTSIIKRKGLTRKEFAKKLIDLSPNVNRIGETPTTSTIYGYLNGRINIPIELVSFIAEALDITEQELFDTSEKTNKKYFKYLIDNLSDREIMSYHKILSNKLLFNGKSVDIDSNFLKTKEFLQNIKYAPSSFLDKVLYYLKQYKALSTNFDKEISF